MVLESISTDGNNQCALKIPMERYDTNIEIRNICNQQFVSPGERKIQQIFMRNSNEAVVFIVQGQFEAFSATPRALFLHAKGAHEKKTVGLQRLCRLRITKVTAAFASLH